MFSIENNTTSLDIDDYYISFETGLPGGSYKMIDIIGDGGIVQGSGNIGARTVKFSRAFTREDESTRDLWMQWFTKPVYEEIYLRKQTTNFNGIQKIYPDINGGESYKTRNFNYSGDIQFEMFMPDPYFESTTVTASTFTLTSTAQLTTSVSITGQKVFASYYFNPTSAAGIFEVKTAEGYGFQFNYTVAAGSSVTVSTTGNELTATVNGSVITGYFSAASTPFELWPGTNTLYIKGSSGTMTVNYYGRRL